MPSQESSTQCINMSEYTNDDITSLVYCPKCIVEPPRKEMKLERGQMRNDFGLESEDGQHKFSAFVRVNEQFRENFTVGLKYHPQEGQSFNVFRCNGPHGNHVDIAQEHQHYQFHIHEVAAASVNEGNAIERCATVTSHYASYEECLRFFLGHINVVDADKHFPEPAPKLPLFDTD